MSFCSSIFLQTGNVLGLRVCAPGLDGRYYPGIIKAINNENEKTKYSVAFEADCFSEFSIPWAQFSSEQLIGPGFQPISSRSVKLLPGQMVYFFHGSREIKAQVVVHKSHIGEIDVKPEGENYVLTKRIDEIHLIKSTWNKTQHSEAFSSNNSDDLFAIPRLNSVGSSAATSDDSDEGSTDRDLESMPSDLFWGFQSFRPALDIVSTPEKGKRPHLQDVFQSLKCESPIFMDQ